MTAPQQHSTGQQQAQAGLAVLTAGALAGAWPLLDPHNLADTTPKFTYAAHAVINQHSLAAATLSARFYAAHRKASGISGRFTAIPAKPPTQQQVAATVDWAVSGLYGPEPDVAAFQDRVTAAAQKLVQDTGRRTVIDNVQRDRQAKAWARVTEADPCYFCAMLATRGAVYKKDTVDFKTHDSCRCHAEPVYNAYEPTAQIREWQALYKQTAPGPGGMKAAQLRWRRAYEGRTGPEPTGSPSRQRISVPAAHDYKTVTPSEAKARQIIGQLEQSIATMRRHGVSKKAIDAAQQRADQLRAALLVRA